MRESFSLSYGSFVPLGILSTHTSLRLLFCAAGSWPIAKSLSSSEIMFATRVSIWLDHWPLTLFRANMYVHYSRNYPAGRRIRGCPIACLTTLGILVERLIYDIVHRSSTSMLEDSEVVQSITNTYSRFAKLYDKLANESLQFSVLQRYINIQLMKKYLGRPQLW